MKVLVLQSYAAGSAFDNLDPAASLAKSKSNQIKAKSNQINSRAFSRACHGVTSMVLAKRTAVSARALTS